MKEEQALRLLVEGTVSETGLEFFRALVRNLAAALGTAGAWVTEYLPAERRLRPYAFWLNGAYLEDYEQPIDHTPCEAVLKCRDLLHIPDHLGDLYPLDPEVRALNVVSYMGVPLLDSDGAIIGHLAVMHDQPLPAEPHLRSLFAIFAARAAAEQRRLKVEREVRAREEQLSALLESAMDGIILLRSDLAITRVNPAARRLFGCADEDLIGQSIREFLQVDSASRVNTFLKEIHASPALSRQLWIPQNLTVLRWDRSTFPAEATLSCFENRGETFYTLILRNVDERIEAEQRIQTLTVQTEYLREEIRALHHFDEIIGQSAPLRTVLGEVAQVAGTDAAVLIQGETGTGKELFARAIHASSLRRTQPLVTVNCAAIPANLIESEFFGHEKGAFTGATAKREGRFALADGGTIFLDEIGELPLDLQGKLLRVLQEGAFEPVGSSRTRRVNVRVIAATNRNLAQEVAENRFRQDLFYRLNVFPLQLPPLRQRPEDIPHLATAFARRFAQRMGRALAPFSPQMLQRLQQYHWPGNVRELQNVIERAVITAVDGQLNLDRALPESALPQSIPSPPEPDGIRTLRDLQNLERENLLRALELTRGRIAGPDGAAARLGMNASTLRSRIRALGIPAPQKKNTTGI